MASDVGLGQADQFPVRTAPVVLSSPLISSSLRRGLGGREAGSSATATICPSTGAVGAVMGVVEARTRGPDRRSLFWPLGSAGFLVAAAALWPAAASRCPD